jgi:purine-binding chemotaxis protein CheW
MDSPINPQQAQLIVFRLDDLRYALRLSAVQRIERVAAIAPLPKAPEIVLGVVNVRGDVIPVVDARKRFRLPPRPVDARDHLILARTSRRPVALLVDQVSGVMSFTDDRLVSAEDILPNLTYVRGVAKLAEGMIFIHDLEEFLSLDEGQRIDTALEALR